jgi:uncharacterized protein
MWNEFDWGIGLRSIHFEDWQTEIDVPVIEVMTDNLIHHEGGPALWHTTQIANRAVDVVLHGVGLNIGGQSPLSIQYLKGLRSLAEKFNPRVISDHLCFTEFGGLQSYELLPLERTEFTLKHVAERVDQVQQFLGRQIALENASAYIDYKKDEIPEPEFMNRIAKETGCGILLDVNNVFVNAHNFEYDALTAVLDYDSTAVVQLHIAGHSVKSDFLYDTHDSPVCEAVWKLLHSTLVHLKENGKTRIPVILENDCPNAELNSLLKELEFAQINYEQKTTAHAQLQGKKNDG